MNLRAARSRGRECFRTRISNAWLSPALRRARKSSPPTSAELGFRLTSITCPGHVHAGSGVSRSLSMKLSRLGLTIHIGPPQSQIFGRGPENLTHAPCLGNAAPRRGRGGSIEDLGDAANANLIEVRFEGGQNPEPVGDSCLATNAHQGSDEGPEEPGPDGSMVIGSIALGLAPDVDRSESRVFGRQGSEPYRRQESLFDHTEDFRRGCTIDQWVGKADGEDLIRAQPVIPLVAVDDVVQATGRLIPKQLLAAHTHARGAVGQRARRGFGSPARFKRRQDGQGIEPEGIDLHRLAMSGREDAVTHL